MGAGRGFSRTGQEPHDAVLPHVHGLLVAVADQLGGNPRGGSCQDVVDVRAKAFAGFLEPDVAHDPVAGEQGDGYPFTQPVLRPGRDAHRQPCAVEFTVGAQVLEEQFVFPRTAPGQDGGFPQFVDVVGDRGVGEDLVGGVLDDHVAGGQPGRGLGDGKQVLLEEGQHLALVAARLDPVLRNGQQAVPVSSGIHQEQPCPGSVQEFLRLGNVFPVALDRHHRRGILQEPAQGRQGRTAAHADQQDKCPCCIRRPVIGVQDEEPLDGRPVGGGPEDEAGGTQGEIREDVVHRNRGHGFPFALIPPDGSVRSPHRNQRSGPQLWNANQACSPLFGFRPMEGAVPKVPATACCFEKVVQQYLAKIVEQPVLSLGTIIVTPVTLGNGWKPWQNPASN
nr:hypothetical protein [Arthrobacter nitrophenolicus]